MHEGILVTGIAQPYVTCDTKINWEFVLILSNKAEVKRILKSKRRSDFFTYGGYSSSNNVLGHPHISFIKNYIFEKDNIKFF